MKALTIPMPLAEDVVAGWFWSVNLTWQTDYRGPLAIHAARQVQGMSRKEAQATFRGVGCILATCDVVACFRLAKPEPEELAAIRACGLAARAIVDQDETRGPFVLVFNEMRPVTEFVEVAGRPRLWDVSRKFLAAHVDALAF